jgi:hypothetical protein
MHSSVPLPTQITELKRERRMRDNVYPGMVATGRLVQSEAFRRNQALDAAIATLQRMAANLESERARIGQGGAVSGGGGA